MDILNKFTIRSLKLNKKRTIVTIIGIILSVALICAVAGIFLSFRETIIQSEIEDSGKYHVMFEDAPTSGIDVVRNNKKIESYYYMQNIGYAEFDSKNPNLPYLYLKGFDDFALSDSGLKLESGRMPKNDSEIVITEKVNVSSNTKYKIGDVLVLDIFDLKGDDTTYEEGNIINVDEEHISLFRKEYTIVGMTQNLGNYRVNSGHKGEITVITYAKEPTDNIDLFVYYKNPKEVDALNTILKDAFHLNIESIYNNSELLRWQGVMGNETLFALYGIIGVVITVIVITSVFVIRNGFAISILERNKEYGILASIGATKKQIKKNVLYEGFILGLIAIPIGVVVGVIAVLALIFIVNTLLTNALTIQILYIIPYPAILSAVILGAITIYLSCFFIARKTSKISPIERVRNSEEIKVKSKKLKTPKLIKKLFKTGGVIAYKNMQRNKKKYRTTVISMVISVVIFITMASFIKYFFTEAANMYKQIDFNIYVSSGSQFEGFYDYAEKVVNLIGDDKYSIVKYKSIDIDTKYINLDFTEYFHFEEDYQYSINVRAIGEDAFREYVEKLGGNYNDYKDKGVLIDNQMIIDDGEKIFGNMYNIKDSIELKGENETINLQIAKKTDVLAMPFAADDYRNNGYIIVSDETIEKIGYDTTSGYMVINSSDPYNLEIEISKLNENLWVNNYLEYKEQIDSLTLVISIFLYGFIAVITIIGLTNVINTLTTSLNLRRKEFAMLKAVGTTSKEFKQVINLECVFLGAKVLMIGIPIGLLFSYLIYYFISTLESTISSYNPNITSILLSVVTVFLIVKVIMSYSLRRINKQNIVETIRNDNI